jgi:hypothetical protein
MTSMVAASLVTKIMHHNQPSTPLYVPTPVQTYSFDVLVCKVSLYVPWRSPLFQVSIQNSLLAIVGFQKLAGQSYPFVARLCWHGAAESLLHPLVGVVLSLPIICSENLTLVFPSTRSFVALKAQMRQP